MGKHGPTCACWRCEGARLSLPGKQIAESDGDLAVAALIEPTIAVKVAIGALCEVGRPDLAMRVNQNRGGWPSMAHDDADADVVVKAFWMGHVAAGHRAQIEDGGIHCEDCWESYP